NDTVVITYDKNSYPIAQSLTSDKLTQQYNFRYKQKDKNAKWNLDSYTIIQFDYFSMLFNTKNNRPKIYNTILKRYHVDFVDLDSVKQSFYAYTKKYHKSLDSLYKAKQISDVYYNYYNYQLKLNKATCKINSYKNNSVDLNKIKQTYTSLFNDSLINRVSYQQFAEKIIPDFFETKKHVDLIETENSCFFDSRQTFDLIANASFPPKTKSCLLFSSTKRIIENFSGNDIQEYLHKYISATNDTISYNCLINENNLDFKSIDKLVLSDTSNMQITFGELLKKHKGKVLYIDFWASWCAPCRASMKSAKVLRQKLQDKNIVFIYLAKNDEKQNWKQAIDKLEIDYLGINYFIENSKTSEILNKLKVTSIPRYMIFDKSGELAYSNAPNPENPEIEDLLLSYINL
ncbi:MAG: TlpA family protein disulfide reductase, partial [Bacteroidales bacterium]|nr:TlpA family protein disulfide reductase [Bacteroidales bacterium]